MFMVEPSDLPAGAVIVIHGGHTTLIDTSKTTAATATATAIVQAIGKDLS